MKEYFSFELIGEIFQQQKRTHFLIFYLFLFPLCEMPVV